MARQRPNGGQPEYLVPEYLPGPLPAEWHGRQLDAQTHRELPDCSQGDNDPVITPCPRGFIIEARMSLQEVKKLDPHSVDFHWNSAWGEFHIRKKNGEALEYQGSMPSIGEELSRMLLDLIWRPGEYRSARSFFPDSKLRWTRLNKLLTARAARFRRAFGESFKESWFILSRRSPFEIAWNPDRSWRFIERVAQPNHQQEEEHGESN